jgi:hypothetical protein
MDLLRLEMTNQLIQIARELGHNVNTVYYILQFRWPIVQFYEKKRFHKMWFIILKRNQLKDICIDIV